MKGREKRTESVCVDYVKGRERDRMVGMRVCYVKGRDRERECVGVCATLCERKKEKRKE